MRLRTLLDDENALAAPRGRGLALGQGRGSRRRAPAEAILGDAL